MTQQTELIQQQLQKLVADLNSARLHGLTDERLDILSRDAREVKRLVRQG